MSCDITISRKCERIRPDLYNCNSCSEFGVLVVDYTEGEEFILISSSIDATAGVYRKQDGCLLMEIKRR